MKQTKNTTLSFIIKGSSGLDFLSFEVGYIMKQTKKYHTVVYYQGVVRAGFSVL